MLGMPQTTNYDVRFRALGIPVRVHPLFWIITAVMGFQDGPLPATFNCLIWIVSVFISILVHEYGHGLTARFFGYDAAIVLYGMGGLCYSESERQTPAQRLAVLISGPGAGFLLAAVVFIADQALGSGLNLPARLFVWDMLVINIFWGLVNLLPIWPLDGGQMMGVILPRVNRRSGTHWTHIVSIVTAAAIALLGLPGALPALGLPELSPSSGYFLLFLFGYLAFINYQALQQIQLADRYGSRDDDWWRG